jgi:PAS domain S-box-containing protein
MDPLILTNRLLLLAAGVVLFAVAYRTTRIRERPTAMSFAALLSLLGVTAFCLGVTARSGWANKLIWLYTNLTIPLALLFFSFDYYGIDALRSRERMALIAAPSFLGAVGGSALVLGTPRATSDGSVPLAALADLPDLAFDAAVALDDIGYIYTGALIVVAVGLVSRTIVQYDHLDTRLGAAIAFIGIWPWLGNFVVPQLQSNSGPLAGLVALSVGYSLSALLAALAVGPLALFRSSPAAATVGPELVLDSMDDAVVMADEHDRILRLNGQASETFGTSGTDAVGRQVADVLGDPSAALAASETVSLATRDGTRQFEVTRSAVSDRTDSPRGHVLVLRDVTDRQTREQRLDVLNRVLRHNLRNDASSILNRAELISQDGAREENAENIIETTRELVGVANRAREVQRMMDGTDTDEPTALADVVDGVVRELRSAHSTVELTTALPDETTVAVDAWTLETVLSNLVENAAEHNDADEPLVVVSAEHDDGTVNVAVSDNGPGIPEHERAVLDAGEEDQLTHGSGLGLWVVHWGVAEMGGTLDISDNDLSGTTVTLSLPGADPQEPHIEAEPAVT